MLDRILLHLECEPWFDCCSGFYGGLLPRLECGLTVLYSCFQATSPILVCRIDEKCASFGIRVGAIR